MEDIKNGKVADDALDSVAGGRGQSINFNENVNVSGNVNEDLMRDAFLSDYGLPYKEHTEDEVENQTEKAKTDVSGW